MSIFEDAQNTYKNYEDAHFVALGGMSTLAEHLDDNSCQARITPLFLEALAIRNERIGKNPIGKDRIGKDRGFLEAEEQERNGIFTRAG